MTRSSTPSKRGQRITRPGPAAHSRARAWRKGSPRGLIITRGLGSSGVSAASRLAATTSARITIPGPPLAGVSSTARWRPSPCSRMSRASSDHNPRASASPASDWPSGPGNMAGKRVRTVQANIGRRLRAHPNAVTGRSSELDLLNRVEIEICARRVLADPDGLVVGEMIGRHRQIVGRGNALKDTAGQIVFRAMARAEESAWPIGRWISGARLRVKQRNAAKMGANADEHEDLGLDGPAPVGCVSRLLVLLRIRVAQLTEKLRILQFIKRRLRPFNDEHRPRRPERDHALARLKRADVDVDRTSRGDRGGVPVHLVDKRPERGCDADRRQRPGRQKEEIPLRYRVAPMAC